VNVLFIESSALLAVVFNEPKRSEAARRMESAERLVASRLVRVETDRALLRLAHDHPELERRIPEMRHELNRIFPRIDFIEITREICDWAGRISPQSRLRALDAIHVATYLRIRELDPTAELLSFDRRILDVV